MTKGVKMPLKVNAIEYSSNVYPQTSSIRQSQGKNDFSAVIFDNASTANSDPANIWKELSEKYNIHNASFEDLCDISKSLYSAGQISLFDHGMLTFRYSIPNMDNATPSYSNGNKDWAAEFQARGQQQLKLNNMDGYVLFQRLAGILDKLD